MKKITIERMTCTRLPTEEAEFMLCLYHSSRDHKEHLALILGEIEDHEGVLVRIHSECFTGDVLGSLRCDCGEQLEQALHLIATEGAGVLLYLRQEGRGIGLYDKLRAYNLQDEGYDTVDANLLLGHQADARDYQEAALILRDLGVTSVRLLTNNPAKIDSLRRHGVQVSHRVPLQMPPNRENAAYLATKVRRMRHLLDLEQVDPLATEQLVRDETAVDRPAVTLTYAQSLDGSIAARRGQPLSLSGPEAMAFTHRLRAAHDAILVGVNTVLADDPRLTVRLATGENPRPVVLDSSLRIPPGARLLQGEKLPWIICTERAPEEREEALVAAGATIIRIASDDSGRVALYPALHQLAAAGIRSLMVEGGAGVITSFLASGLADRLVVTVVPLLVGGLAAAGTLAGRLNGQPFPRLRRPHYRQLGRDIVVSGELVQEEDA